LLIIGDKKDISLTDKEVIEYAIEVMERKISQNTAYRTYKAGLSALEAFRDAMLDQSNGLVEKPDHSHFIHLMILNIAEPRAYIAGFMNRLSKKYADNITLSQAFTNLEEISVAIQKPCHEMWGVKDNKELTANEKRNKLTELIQVCIDYDKNTLTLLKEVAKLL
jgi:hypothetical protein